MLALRTVIVGVLALLSLPGCASNEIKWTEEVRLHDGTVVQVKRRIELSGANYPAQYRGSEKYHELCYAPLGVYWKSRTEYRPEVFGIVDGKVYVKVPVNGCIECKLQGFPEWDSLYFVWENGAWKKVDENDSLRSLRFNLLSASYYLDDGKRDARGLVTLAEKEGPRDGSIYRGMKLTGRTGPHSPGECKKCRAQQITTSATADVFLSAETRSCSW